ncbi:MAG: aminoacylase [Phycisphaerales bacterium]|nr:aminoacylase [Phycisphaerales bacterium]
MVTAALLAPAAARSASAAPAYDLVVRHGKVIDGTGKPAFAADVAIKDGKIAAVGDVPAGSAAAELDAAGLAVAPGFIDVHTHVDDDILKFPAGENFVRDGVTTIVSGNCGGSVSDVGSFFERMRAKGAGLDVATLYGHNTVLRAVKGDRKGVLTPAQLEKARGLVRKAMADGAVGLSTGLIYNPGQFSPTEEIVELAKVAGEAGGLYATHMRSEGSSVVAAIDEALRVGREGKLRVEISHFKLPTEAAKKLGGPDVTLAKVRAARDGGQDVWLDQYPYTASSTTISTLLPDTFLEAGVANAQKRLADPAGYAEALTGMLDYHAKKLGRTSFAYVAIASSRGYPQYNGMNVPQVARAMAAAAAAKNNGGELLAAAPTGSPPASGPAAAAGAEPDMEAQCRAILDLFKAGSVQCVFHSMDEGGVEHIMASPLVAVASDSGLREFGVGVPHPRGYGTNSRVLGRYARERKLFTVEEAVRKMTSLPAATFRFADRGRVAVGLVADLTLFDPATVEDKATFDKPHQYPVGIPTVIVQGVPVLKDGKLTGALPGKPVLGPGVGKAAADAR